MPRALQMDWDLQRRVRHGGLVVEVSSLVRPVGKSPEDCIKI